ncbi:hypothetical protein C7G42_29635 [Bradyrhizobium sp. MOS003]|nr:hypothetical protein C7G42_29635 [Bradyrhizobium sp. MOS003]
MRADLHPDDLRRLVSHALETTRATAVCPFHDEVVIRVGDDAAKSHALERAKRIPKSNGSSWDGQTLKDEIGRQLGAAADGRCPKCDAAQDTSA